MEIGRCYLDIIWCGTVDLRNSNSLNLQTIFPDDSRRRLHRSQRAGRPRRALHIQEGDLRSIGRKGRRLFKALQLRDTVRRIAVESRDVEIVLPAGLRTVRKEGECF